MSILATRLQEFVETIDVDKNETRASMTGVLNTAIRQTDEVGSIITPEQKDMIKKSMGIGVKIPRIDFDDGVTIQSVTQPLVVADTPINSRFQALVFKDYYFGFKINESKHANNHITMQREFAEKLSKHIYKLMSVLEADGVAVLELAKTQILADDLGGRYSLVGNTVQAPLAEQDSIMGDINLLMQGNQYYDPLDIVGNGSLKSLMNRRLGEKGTYNSEDKTYQYVDKDFSFSHAIVNAASQIATGYAIPKGSVAFVQAFDPTCNMGENLADGYQSGDYVWDKGVLPIIDIPVGMYSYKGAENLNALGAHTAHLTATPVQAFGFHFRAAFVVADVSDPTTNAQPIMKFQVANA